jgi:hypothetical protein
MVIAFMPLENPKKKRRANAKRQTQNSVAHFHEEFEFKDWLVKVVAAVGRQDLLANSALYNRTASANSFTLSYTVPRKVTDEILIRNEDDFKEMVDAVCSMNSDNRCRISIEEQVVDKVSISQLYAHCASFAEPFIKPSGHGSEADESENDESEDDSRKRKKSKTVSIAIS